MADSDAFEKLKKLTAREKEILKLFCEGYLYTEISKKLYCSNSTVKSHMGNIYVKLGLDLLPRRARIITLSDVYCKALKDSEYLPSEDVEGVEAGIEETVIVDAEETAELGAEENIESDAYENIEEDDVENIEENIEKNDVENNGEKAEESEDDLPEPISKALLKVVEEDDGGPHKDHEGEIIKIVPVNPPDQEKQFKPNPFIIGFMIIALISILFTGYSIYNRFFGPTPVPPSVSPEQPVAQAVSPADNQPEPTNTIQPSPIVMESPVATATLLPKPAVLFEDNFDQGLSEAWEVVSGNPIIVNGMLTTDQDTWLLVGDSEWVNYSIEFRTDSNNGFFWEGYNTVGIHVSDIDNMYAYKWAEYESASYIIENGNWNEVPQSEFDPSNEMKNFRLTIENSLITIYENGEKRTSYYDSRFEKGRIAIKIFAETVVDDFIVREIFE